MVRRQIQFLHYLTSGGGTNFRNLRHMSVRPVYVGVWGHGDGSGATIWSSMCYIYIWVRSCNKLVTNNEHEWKARDSTTQCKWGWQPHYNILIHSAFKEFATTQIVKQTSKYANKQTNEQTNKQTNKHWSPSVICGMTVTRWKGVLVLLRYCFGALIR